MKLEQTSRITYLISRRFTDTLSEEEEKELEDWLVADEQNRLFVENLIQEHFFVQRQREENQYDSRTAFQNVRSRYQHHRNRFRRMLAWSSVAAILVLFIGGTLFIRFLRQQEPVLQAVVAVLPAGESRAILTLADGRRMQLGHNMMDSIVENVGTSLKVTQDELVYRDSGARVELEYNVLEIPRKGEFKLILADGTKVWLNSESQIKYPVKFGQKERRVYLEGEAYFEVFKNKEVPFIVDMGKASLQVLGTSFNARAYKDEAGVFATLTEGKIQLNNGRQSLVLHPEEQGIVDVRTGELTKKKVDPRLYSGWKDGRFIFQEQTLNEIMNTLSRWYDIRVIFENEAVRKVTFTGNLKRYDSFDKIIDMLEMTDMAHFKVDGNAIIISK